MKKFPALLLLSGFVFSCQTGPNFRNMTAQELGQYNLNRPVEERVHCYMQEHTRSRIPRVTCQTLG